MTASFHRTVLASALAISLLALTMPAAAQTSGSWRGGSAPDTPIRTTALPPSGAAAGSEIADRYLERARTDRENADVWVYCAAAALKRSSAGDADADAYARDIAATLKATLDDPGASPCEDAIPAELWGGVQPSAMSGSSRDRPAVRRPAGESPAIERPAEDGIAAPDPGTLTPAEEERLRRANAEADAQERARVAAQAAAQQHRDDAQARYDRERADYEAQAAAAKVADEEYRRELAEHRRLLESGQYQAPR